MRYARIFLLNFQSILTDRGRVFVWFLVSLLNPLLILFYWMAALRSGNQEITGWTLPYVTSYYFLLIIASSVLMAHQEDDVARNDIQMGMLVKYLTKPFSYYWAKFLEELPYRIFQGCLGVVVCIFFLLIFGNFFAFASSPLVIFLAILIAILAFCISFTFKMVLGLTALWTVETSGVFQIFEVAGLLFGGFIVPLTLLPDLLAKLGYLLPFSYMVYFPVVAFQGTLAVEELLLVIFGQIVWLILLALLYIFMWKKGREKFLAVGQ